MAFSSKATWHTADRTGLSGGSATLAKTRKTVIGERKRDNLKDEAA